MTYRIMKTNISFGQYDIKWKMGGGGGSLYFMWFPEGSLDSNFVRRGGGSSKIWMMDQISAAP